MAKGKKLKRVLSAALAVVMLLGLAAPALAQEDEGNGVRVVQVDNSAVTPKVELERPTLHAEEMPLGNQTVRVAIVLDGKSTMDAGYALEGVADNAAAVAYRAGLQRTQARMEDVISARALGGERLDVVWNFTLAANIISANVPYGKLDAIRAVPGVKDVVLETRYDLTDDTVAAESPNMATSGGMIGTTVAYDGGYTGAGQRIAIIDTGTDTDHRSFAADSFEYAILEDAKKVDESVADFAGAAEKLDLMTKEDVLELLPQLNIASKVAENEKDKLYYTSKLPFGYNYVDSDYDITHDNDNGSEHGSHVAGISAANRYVTVKNGEQTEFKPALDEVKTQGVAPDAQILTMKVFGKRGGAYDSDYMAAIEDAIVLGADSINLSLGSSSAGRPTSRL